MPFGLCNAPSCFQRTMNEALGPLRWSVCLVYMDDVIIYGKTFEEMMKNLDMVLKKLSKIGLRIKLKKCEFAKQETEYLGYIIGNGKVKPSLLKTRAIQDYPTPTNSKHLQQFLGLAGYYRKFVKGFAEITNPLRNLLKKNTTWVWNNSQVNAFNLLKKELTGPPTLCTYNPDLPVEIRTDASGYGLGAILVQKDNQNNVLGVISYASRYLSHAEKNYSTTEKEALAVLWAVTEKFRPYVEGKHFVVVSDHAALAGELKVKNPAHRLLRFITKLQGYNYRVVYSKGSKHVDADALSRSPIQSEVMCTMADLCGQEQDERKWNALKKILRKNPGEQTRKEHNKVCKFKLINDVLYFSAKGQDPRLVLPKIRHSEMLKECHDSLDGGHFDTRRTYHALRRRFYWPFQYQDVKRYVTTCNKCQIMNRHTGPRAGLMQPMMAESAMDCIGIDFEGPFSVTSNRHRYIITAIDYHSRLAFAAPVSEANSASACRFLHDIIVRQHGPPKILISDRGTPFLSSSFQDLLRTFGIEHRCSTAYHPQTNGLCEKWNGVLLGIMRKYVKNHKQWSQYLSSAVWAYNISVHSITGVTPFSLFYGRHPRSAVDLQYDLPRKPYNQNSRDVANRRTASARKKQANRYDSSRKQLLFNIDDEVWWEPVIIPKPGEVRKLLPSRQGPYKVVTQLSPILFRIKNKHREFVAHVSRLRKLRHRSVL